MFKKLIITESNFVYIRLKALIWEKNGLISHATLTFSAIESLREIFENSEIRKPLIVSCKGVVDCGDRGLENFFSEVVKRSQRPIVFIHTNSLIDPLIDTLGRIGSNAPNYENIPKKNILKVNCDGNSIQINLQTLNSDIQDVEQRFITDTIKACYKRNDTGQIRLLSTVVMAGGEFDAGKIISEPHLFIWMCLFLAEKLDLYIKNEIEEKEKNPNAPEIKLLAVSLRGCPFAGAVSLLINKSYDTIDHLGPKHKLFDIELLNNFKKGVRYIYMGDFIVGGTEVKIAKAYAELLGCELNHAIVLSSLLEPEVFKDNFILISLTKIKDVIPDAEYQLYK